MVLNGPSTDPLKTLQMHVSQLNMQNFNLPDIKAIETMALTLFKTWAGHDKKS